MPRICRCRTRSQSKARCSRDLISVSLRRALVANARIEPGPSTRRQRMISPRPSVTAQRPAQGAPHTRGSLAPKSTQSAIEPPQGNADCSAPRIGIECDNDKCEAWRGDGERFRKTSPQLQRAGDGSSKFRENPHVPTYAPLFSRIFPRLTGAHYVVPRSFRRSHRPNAKDAMRAGHLFSVSLARGQAHSR
jgi:hypothetical protein